MGSRIAKPPNHFAFLPSSASALVIWWLGVRDDRTFMRRALGGCGKRWPVVRLHARRAFLPEGIERDHPEPERGVVHGVESARVFHDRMSPGRIAQKILGHHADVGRVGPEIP